MSTPRIVETPEGYLVGEQFTADLTVARELLAEAEVAERIDPLAPYGVWELSNIAESASPDRWDSEGAKFLQRVQDDVYEIEAERFLQAARDGQISWEFDDDASAIADNAPSVYTSTLWAQFVDLGAYQEGEQVWEILGTRLPDQLDKVASAALYVIAERLAKELIQRRFDAAVEVVSNEDDDDLESDSPVSPAGGSGSELSDEEIQALTPEHRTAYILSRFGL